MHRVVKLSSPNLNYLIIVGAALLYACVYLYVTPVSDQSSTTILCNVSFARLIPDNYTHRVTFSCLVKALDFFIWVYLVFCCHSLKNMASILHFQQSHHQKESMITFFNFCTW